MVQHSVRDMELRTDLDNLICPICLDFPHNSVLIQCSSYGKGCHPFVCDTSHLHSNCLDRFKSACSMKSSMSNATTYGNSEPVVSESEEKLNCPLCRGEVSGWVVVDKARAYLDKKKRSCEEEQCTFMGTYSELQEHALLEHPHSHPSKIDPARLLDWENFQQSSEIIDVLSMIHSQVPRGVVLGDYVIGDEPENFPREEGNWWTSCIFYQVFNNIWNSRNRRRSRVGDTRRGNQRLSYAISHSDNVSVASWWYAEPELYETDDEFAGTHGSARGSSSHHRSMHVCLPIGSSQRRRSRLHNN